MGIEQSSSMYGAPCDDELKKEVEGMARSGRPTRPEECKIPEPAKDEYSPSEDEQIGPRRTEEAGRTRGDSTDATDNVRRPTEGEEAMDATDTPDPEPAGDSRAW